MNMHKCENKKCGIYHKGHRLIIGGIAYCGFACNRDNEKIKPKLDKPLK